MKTILISAKRISHLDRNILISNLKKLKLPKNIAIYYSIQFQDEALEIKNILNKKHKIRQFSQVLGCSKINLREENAVILIGSGKFHAINIAFQLESKIPVYILEGNSFYKINNNEIDLFKRKKQASYIKYLHSKSIGIIVSLKPGQENFKKAIEIKNKLEKNNKIPYLFLTSDINFKDLDNFPHIGSWINTACPRLDMDADARVVNIGEVLMEI
ncbi:MAG: diphthamide synthesis protein [Nanoarchaeota archaeon]